MRLCDYFSAIIPLFHASRQCKVIWNTKNECETHEVKKLMWNIRPVNYFVSGVDAYWVWKVLPCSKSQAFPVLPMPHNLISFLCPSIQLLYVMLCELVGISFFCKSKVQHFFVVVASEFLHFYYHLDGLNWMK